MDEEENAMDINLLGLGMGGDGNENIDSFEDEVIDAAVNTKIQNTDDMC
jgi:hypothetical protein